MLSVAPGAMAAPVPDFTISPASPLPGQTVTFDASPSQSDGDPILDYSWSSGNGAIGTGPVFTNPYDAGIYNVTLTVSDGFDPPVAVTKQIIVNTPPSPNFLVFPEQGVAGQALDLVSVSGDADGHGIARHEWNFGDGSPGVTGSHVQHAFRQPGLPMVSLTATDTLGGFSSIQKPVRVISGVVLALPEEDLRRLPEQPELRLLSPFPLVRLVGDLTDTGARIRVLSVRAPRRSAITVRCRGGNCPARRIKTRSRGRTLSFKRYRRNLRAGAVIEVLVSRKDRIGKYTRFRIREGRSPKRMDRCLMPGATKGSRCPDD